MLLENQEDILYEEHDKFVNVCRRGNLRPGGKVHPP
jgi:hypothetical protein